MPELKFSFDIDDGELYGLTEQEIFVLGFELGSLFVRISDGTLVNANKFVIHRSNRERIEKLLETYEYEYNMIDTSEDAWVEFHVEIGEG